jgi:hypothetical protein
MFLKLSALGIELFGTDVRSEKPAIGSEKMGDVLILARTEMQVRRRRDLLRADAVFHACVLRVLACA